MTAPLDGVRVLDLSRLLPGPYLTQLLCDLGADVIKLEAPEGGDYLRHLPPLCGEVSAVFAALNRGKRSLALDLKDAQGRDQFLDLCERVDVVVESFRPGVLERLKLGPEVLQARNPRLILCRISGYGQQGPDALRAGHDLNYTARAGVLGMAAQPEVLPVQVADMVGGALLPAIQILAALRQRDREGHGAVIDAALVDGAWAMLVWPLAQHLACGEPLQPGAGYLQGGIPAYNCYPTADGALAVAALEPKFWEPLCEALQRPDLRPMGVATGEQGAAVKRELEALFRTRTTERWMQLLEPLDCCVEPVRDPRRAHLEDPALSRRDLVAEVEVSGQRVQLPLTPVVVGADTRSRLGPPALGQHSDEILAWLAGR
ncbi:MAG: CaiB/BaiF CoA-transferase family protein [Pseudomonadota bacterium]